MNQKIQRIEKAALRREVASWQKGAIGLLIFAVIVSSVLYILLYMQNQEATHWENKYRAALQIEQDAIQAYADLSAQMDAEKAAREAKEAAYVELEGYEYMGTFKITHYCCEPYEHICGTGDGITAMGLPVAPGMVAVDPKVIPMGSTVIIDGIEYLAADTGVTGAHIDIAVPTHAEAEKLGVTFANVWVVERG